MPVKGSVSRVRLDPGKYDKQLKEIQERLEEEALLADENAEELLEEEQSSEAPIIEGLILAENEDASLTGRINISFPEAIEEFRNSPLCYPSSYYTLSSKERLLLLYVENFRHQYVINNQNHRPLLLAPPNECGIQKFVCTTIRPTAFLNTSLVRNDKACTSFVADFITYEPLANMMTLPQRLISPDTLLRRRRGNSFEMATLLCSMLIGAGFPAVVVSGVARAEVVECDQRELPYPHNMPKIELEEEVKVKPKTGEKYKLRPLPDLTSHLEENMEKLLAERAAGEQRIKDEALKKQLEELEIRPVDKYHYRRSHAWVAIIDNAPWSFKPKSTHVNEDGDVEYDPPKARFIEPSTGFTADSRSKQYILIDSVWNQYNYYVNKQTYERVSEIRWDLRNTDDWEHILPGEPPEMRTYLVHSDENVADIAHPVEEERHLDTIRSWVMKLHIGEREFEERFPKLQKTILYKGAKHERFSPYTQRDGKVMQLTLYEDDEYKERVERWEMYENRSDKLLQLKYTYETNEYEECFAKGRNDSLKYMRHNKDPNKPKELHFYSSPRLDSLYHLVIEKDRITLQYRGRNDLCYYQQYEFRPAGTVLRKIVEKFHRDNTLPADKDIAMRTILIPQQKILLKFQYARGALTASTCEFVKPPRPDYGQEIVFDPNLVKMYLANISEPSPTPLETYRLLIQQLKIEDKMKKRFEKIIEEITSILENRRNESDEPKLTFRIFDALRNGAARTQRLQQKADEEAYKRDMQTQPADYLAPYLVPYKGRYLNYNESWAIYNACLSDMKTRFVFLLNDLQRQYEDLITESKSLKRFLYKFEDQFNNYDYEQLVLEGKQISLNQRMVQQRLAITHEESQKKYESVKEALLNDPRLNLRSSLQKK